MNSVTCAFWGVIVLVVDLCKEEWPGGVGSWKVAAGGQRCSREWEKWPEDS